MTKHTLHLKALSPQGVVYEGDVLSVSFPGAAGSFAVFPSHAPLIAALKAGSIAFYTAPDRQETVRLLSGFVEVNSDIVTVCIEEDKENAG
jgi:F-type H+-transporting ATPase subunit epsilon